MMGRLSTAVRCVWQETATMAARRAADEPTSSDADAGTYRGRSVARRFVSPDGFVVLVGRSAADNDIVTFKLGTPHDFWLHVSGESGSHVIVRNPDGVERLPRETLRYAAALAAGYSKARNAGRVAVHVARCGDVRKPRGVPPGTVTLKQFTTLHVAPARGDTDGD
jgi:predicted ribosome quality control (RQC) complex YloA/Tae2 family protein